MCDKEEERERYSGGKTDSPCAFAHETPEWPPAQITRTWRWGREACCQTVAKL